MSYPPAPIAIKPSCCASRLAEPRSGERPSGMRGQGALPPGKVSTGGLNRPTMRVFQNGTAFGRERIPARPSHGLIPAARRLRAAGLIPTTRRVHRQSHP